MFQSYEFKHCVKAFYAWLYARHSLIIGTTSEVQLKQTYHIGIKDVKAICTAAKSNSIQEILDKHVLLWLQNALVIKYLYEQKWATSTIPKVSAILHMQLLRRSPEWLRYLSIMGGASLVIDTHSNRCRYRKPYSSMGITAVETIFAWAESCHIFWSIVPKMER